MAKYRRLYGLNNVGPPIIALHDDEPMTGIECEEDDGVTGAGAEELSK
jgi:hypothetical protein